MSLDEALHFLGGYMKALPWRIASPGAREQRIFTIDLYGWSREVAQHDPELTEHQISEARAWGRGARACLGVDPPYPSPPYPA